MVGGGDFGIQDDHRELTPFRDVGDLLNASSFLEPEVSPVHSSALDSVVGVYAEDSVMHVGDADGTVAMVDTDDRAADAEMVVDLGGLEDVVEGFFAAASAPSPVLLDQVTLGMEMQVPEEEAMVGPGVVAFLAAQEKAKLTAWQQAFSRIPHKFFLQSVQGEPTTGVTCMEATYPNGTMSCSEAFRASFTAYDLAMEGVKDTYFKPYIEIFRNCRVSGSERIKKCPCASQPRTGSHKSAVYSGYHGLHGECWHLCHKIRQVV